jgi:protein phosphatase
MAHAPERSLLTRALGVAPVVDLDLSRPALVGGARLLLCTDGLTAQAGEADIAGVLSAFADPDQAAVELVRLANRNGGADNTAVVVVDISQ